MKNRYVQHLLEINLAMFFIATSGALGRYVQLPVPVTIASRALLACVFLYLFCLWKGISLKVHKNDLPVILFAGFLMGVHWVTYFYSLQLSTVAIGMLSLFTYPVMTAFLEPLILKTKLEGIHVLLALLVLIGIYFLNPNLDFDNSKTIAIGFGLFSALAYALRNVLMKKKISTYHGSMLMVYQTAFVGVILFPFFSMTTTTKLFGQWEGILMLALLTTAIGHTLFLMTFNHFKITTVSILSSIQPVYGILIGAVFLSEIPKLNTILGGTLILSAVLIESIRSKTLTS